MTIRGNQFYLNGVRINLRGESTNTHAQGYDSGRYKLMSPATWGATIERMKLLGINVLRLHMSPAPEWMLDIADEKGLLIIAESAIYAKEYIRPADKPKYLQNAKSWLASWVRGSRNHPSIIGWSAENEMGVGWLNWMTNPEIKSLGDTIRALDPTRYVSYDGDRDVGDKVGQAVVNWHYPEGYMNEPKGSIYSWADKVHKDKPTGIGEFITSYGKNEARNRWWQGTWVRGLRYTNWTDVRPYTLGWAYEDEAAMKTAAAQNLKSSLAPVALFDKAYDDLGVDPLIAAAEGRVSELPALDVNSMAERTLVLYNDEARGETVSVRVFLSDGERLIGQAGNDFRVQPGHKREIKLRFQVPPSFGADSMIQLLLQTEKNGQIKFSEARRFRARPSNALPHGPGGITLE